MFVEEVKAASNAAVAKKNLLNNNFIGYFVMAMMAGAFIGFGNLLTNTLGGLLAGSVATKLVMGATFPVALSLVIVAGGELFTGNNMVMGMGVLAKKVTIGDALKLWAICWLGNLAGGIVLSVLFHFSGLNSEAVGTFLATGAAAKMSAPALQLFIRGILCNMLVSLAVWCGFRTKSDTTKLIMTFWCLLAFVTPGFEHCVANMTQLTVALMDPYGQAVSIGGYVYNMIFVTLGNIVGGAVFVAVPYYLAQLKDAKQA